VANDRALALLLALVAAAATIIGGTIGGAASYFATREANRAVIERDERNDLLQARSAARLVDNELAVIQATLDTANARTARQLRKLPRSAWAAQQQRLARTLSAREWGYVSQAYTLILLLPSSAPVSGMTVKFVHSNVRWARRELAGYL
jgi:hypothetical protein